MVQDNLSRLLLMKNLKDSEEIINVKFPNIIEDENEI